VTQSFSSHFIKLGIVIISWKEIKRAFSVLMMAAITIQTTAPEAAAPTKSESSTDK
jgi:hypothetical protein